MPPAVKPKPPATGSKPDKKKLVAIGALLTSTPFLIAIAVHILLLLVGGSVVIFKGGNPLAIFTSQEVGDGDPGAEAEAPPSPEDPAPEPESKPTAVEAEVPPAEMQESSDVLALSTPSTVPSFAPPAPTKATGTAVVGFGSSGGGGGSSGIGGRKKARSGKGSLFGFDEALEDDLIGTMYDLKFDSSGKKPTGLGPKGNPGVTDDDFYKACRELLAGNRVNDSALRRYFAVPKRLGATQLFIPYRQADEAPRSFGVADKVKPNFWVIHYKGRFSAPVSGQYRFIGKADDLLWVAVEGRTVLEAHWDNNSFLTSWRPKDHINEHSIYDFMEGNTEDDKKKAFLTYGDWMNLDAGKPKDLEILLGEYGGGRFFAVLLIQQKGGKEKMGKSKDRPVYPLFVTADPDGAQRMTMRNSKLEFPRETPVFGASQRPETAAGPATSESMDSAESDSYEAGWTESGETEGFGGWVLRSNGDESKSSYAGFYVAKEEEKTEITPVASAGKAWGFYADGVGSEEAVAFRSFLHPLTPQQAFSLEFIFPPPASPDGVIGFALRSGDKATSLSDYNAGARMEFFAQGGKPNFQISDGQGTLDSGVPVSMEGLRVEVTIKTIDSYDLKLTPLAGEKPVEWKDRKLAGESGSALQSFSLFNRNSEKNAFANRLKIRR